jgi:hypothetical protein
MRVTAVRSASREVIDARLAYWRTRADLIPLVLAANTVVATLAWTLVDMIMR